MPYIPENVGNGGNGGNAGNVKAGSRNACYAGGKTRP